MVLGMLPPIASCALALSIASGLLPAQFDAIYNSPPIRYGDSEASDPVAELARRIESGDTTLEHDDDHGYLAAVLEVLGIPATSQGTGVLEDEFPEHAHLTTQPARGLLR